MAIDRKYVFDRVAFHLKKETKFFASSDLHLMVGVDVWKRIAEEIGYPRKSFSAPVGPTTWTVGPPSDFVRLDFHKETTLRQEPDKTISSGVPKNYFMEGTSSVGFFPQLTTSGYISIPYVFEPTSLSTDAATNELTERCYQAAVYWVVSECMLKDNDNRFNAYLGLYKSEIQRKKDEYGIIGGRPGDLEVHEQPVRVRP